MQRNRSNSNITKKVRIWQAYHRMRSSHGIALIVGGQRLLEVTRKGLSPCGGLNGELSQGWTHRGKWQSLGPHFSIELMRLVIGVAVWLERERGIRVAHSFLIQELNELRTISNDS